ncbi:MAG: glycosyltransferase family 4 protein [Proteobacteria bacterium]|nr:glycosyltransferase family 4 protein [Pseudomonadota bacterium]
MPLARTIVIVVGSMSTGGAERVAATLANAWSARGRRVWVVATFLGTSGSAYPLQSGVSQVFLSDMIPLRGLCPPLPGKLLALRALVKKVRPDVVVSFLTNVNVTVLGALGYLGVPLVISERVDPAADVELPGMLKLARGLLYRRAEALVVQTEAAAAHYRGRVSRLPPMRVVPNPLPADLASMSTRASHSSRGGCVIAMGRLTAQKGHTALIEAFARAFVDAEEWQLQIWGEGPLREQLQQRIEALGLAGRIRLCGLTAQPWSALAKGQIFAMTSLYEGFPNAMLEAQALGLACIAFDCPSGPRELSDGGSAAVIVPAGDVEGFALALRRLADNAAGREQLGQRAATFVRQQFAESTVLRAWDELLDEVIADKGSRSPGDGAPP